MSTISIVESNASKDEKIIKEVLASNPKLASINHLAQLGTSGFFNMEVPKYRVNTIKYCKYCGAEVERDENKKIKCKNCSNNK